jgi:hypothetical protein
MSLNKKNIKIAKAGFEYKCLFIFIDAHRKMKLENNYNISWKENKITKVLAKYVKESELAKKWSLDIVREYYLDDYQEENTDPDETPRIDIRFSQWNGNTIFEYFIEAKNLCEKDWIKESGSKVSSSFQLNRYVNYGVSHFISGYYPLYGCLCGYILEGNNDIIINKLNDILEKKSFNRLQIAKTINGHSMIYKIRHDDKELLNIFFDYK